MLYSTRGFTRTYLGYLQANTPAQVAAKSGLSCHNTFCLFKLCTYLALSHHFAYCPILHIFALCLPACLCMVGSLRASSAKNLHNPGKLAQGTEEQRSWVSEEGTQIDVGYGHLYIFKVYEL